MEYKEAVIAKYMIDMAKEVNIDYDLPPIEDIVEWVKSLFVQKRNKLNDSEYKLAAMFVMEFSRDRILYRLSQ